MTRVPGGARGVSDITRRISAALSGSARSSGVGMSARKPEVCVSSCRTVIAGVWNSGT